MLQVKKKSSRNYGWQGPGIVLLLACIAAPLGSVLPLGSQAHASSWFRTCGVLYRESGDKRLYAYEPDKIKSVYSFVDEAVFGSKVLTEAAAWAQGNGLPDPEQHIQNDFTASKRPTWCSGDSSFKNSYPQPGREGYSVILGRIRKGSEITDLGEYDPADKSLNIVPEQLAKGEAAADFLMTLPHELFHAIQAATGNFDQGDTSDRAKWVEEGLADMFGNKFFRDHYLASNQNDLFGKKDALLGTEYPFTAQDDFAALGYRSYYSPLHLPEKEQQKRLAGYETSSFWRFIVEEGQGWPLIEKLLSAKNPASSKCAGNARDSEACALAELQWLDEQLKKSDADNALYLTFPRFLAWYSEEIRRFAWRHTKQSLAVFRDKDGNRFGRMDIEIAKEKAFSPEGEVCASLLVSRNEPDVKTKPLKVLGLGARCITVSAPDLSHGVLTIEISHEDETSEQLHLIVDDKYYEKPGNPAVEAVGSAARTTAAVINAVTPALVNRAEFQLQAYRSPAQRRWFVVVGNVKHDAVKTGWQAFELRAYVSGGHSSNVTGTGNSPGGRGSPGGVETKQGTESAGRMDRQRTGSQVPRSGEELSSFGGRETSWETAGRFMELSVIPLTPGVERSGIGQLLQTAANGRSIEITMPYVPLGSTGTWPAAIVIRDASGLREQRVYKGVSLVDKAWEWNGRVTFTTNTNERLTGTYRADGVDVQAVNDAIIGPGGSLPGSVKVGLDGNFDLPWHSTDEEDPELMISKNLPLPNIGALQQAAAEFELEVVDQGGSNSSASGGACDPLMDLDCDTREKSTGGGFRITIKSELERAYYEALKRQPGISDAEIYGELMSFRMLSPSRQQAELAKKSRRN